MSDASLLRLAVTCPRCYRAPRLRTVPAIQLLMNVNDPDQVIVTYQCHKCEEIYAIRVRHFKGAG